MTTAQFPTPDDVKPTDATIDAEMALLIPALKDGCRSFRVPASVGVYMIERIRAKGWGVTHHQNGSEMDLFLWVPRDKIASATPPS